MNLKAKNLAVIVLLPQQAFFSLQTLKKLYDDAKEVVKDVGEVIGEKAEVTGDKLKNIGGNAVDWVKEHGGNAVDTIQETGENVMDTVRCRFGDDDKCEKENDEKPEEVTAAPDADGDDKEPEVEEKERKLIARLVRELLNKRK